MLSTKQYIAPLRHAQLATEKKLHPELVYLHFYPSTPTSTATTNQYVTDLRHLRSLLGPTSGLGFTVVEMSLEPTAAFREIQGLNKRLPETADTVSALRRGPLFQFRPSELTAIQ